MKSTHFFVSSFDLICQVELNWETQLPMLNRRHSYSSKAGKQTCLSYLVTALISLV